MNHKNSMDGFVLRRRSQNSDISRQRPSITGNRAVPERFLIDPTKGVAEKAAHTKGAPLLKRTSGPAALATDESLTLPTPVRGDRLDLNKMHLEDEPGGKSKKPKKDRKQRIRKKWSRKRLIITISSVVAACLLIFGGYFAYKFLNAGGKIFKGNVIAAIFDTAQPLKEDANGRSNILLFGTSEDDPGHPGGDLTDSIMVVSVNQKKHDAFVTSIPRDLHVDYGRACIPGYQGKINALYSCIKDEGEEAAAGVLKAKVGEILGLDIQYYTHVNYTVLRESVNAVGGITVNIESTDSRGILDRNFDWRCNYKCYLVKYPIGPAQLDGDHALWLANARGDDNGMVTYGLSRSNPDRQDNQRKILIALKDKASSAGVLANPVAVNNLLDTLGNNLRTNFDVKEIKTLLTLGNDVKSDEITSFSLEDPIKPLATATCFTHDKCPNAGSFSYGPIQAAIAALSTGDKASLEYAKIDVLNASGTPGLAQTKADELQTKNLTVSLVSNAPTSLGDKPLKFYDLTGGKKPATLKKLKELLGVEVTTGVPAGVSTNSDFVVVVGVQPAAAAPAQ